MMQVLGNITWFVMALTVIVIFLCICVVGLAVLDYALDSDIKGALVTALGPRHFLRGIRLQFLKLAKRIDTPSYEDLDICENGVWHGGENYDAEIDKLLKEIKEAGNAKKTG